MKELKMDPFCTVAQTNLVLEQMLHALKLGVSCVIEIWRSIRVKG